MEANAVSLGMILSTLPIFNASMAARFHPEDDVGSAVLFRIPRGPRNCINLSIPLARMLCHFDDPVPSSREVAALTWRGTVRSMTRDLTSAARPKNARTI